MPQKPKNVKKKNAQVPPAKNVTLQNADTLMSSFIKYYKGIGIVPESEWTHFFESLFKELPFVFRICENHRKINNILEGKPGTLGQADVLKEFLKNSIIPKVADVKVEDVPFEMTPLPWYPKQLAWQTNVNSHAFHHCKDLKPLTDFVIQEDKVAFISKEEISNMIPPLLVDISPNHKILELCAAPGYQTIQILEKLYNSPKKLPEGFLVANDIGYLNYRWLQGTNILLTHENAKTFPDLYTTEEHLPESKVMYDRIFIDAPSTDDGAMRSNKKDRSAWNILTAQKNHNDLKAMLRRGLELLELNGQLIYITESMNPIENEAVVAALLKEAPETLELVDVKNRLPQFHVRPGMTSWKVMSQGLVFYESFDASPSWFQKENEASLFPPPEDQVGIYNLDRCLRVLPHDNDTGAFFAAVFTKFGPLPWQKEEPKEEAMETELTAKEEKPEVNGTGAATAGAATGVSDKKKSKYILPVRLEVQVSVAEIEWKTACTNEALQTKETTDTSQFGLPAMKIVDSCIPAWLKKEMAAATCRHEPVAVDDCHWLAYRDMFDVKKVNPLLNMLKFVQEGKYTLYYYYSTAIRSLIMSNQTIAKKSSAQCGGCLTIRYPEGGNMEVKTIQPVLQHVTKRLVNIARVDLMKLLNNREVIIKDLTDKSQKDLAAISETGPVYFLYEPKGKTADPKCAIMIWRQKYPMYVKDEHFDRPERKHCLRLCGIDPDKTESKVEEVKMD